MCLSAWSVNTTIFLFSLSKCHIHFSVEIPSMMLLITLVSFRFYFPEFTINKPQVGFIPTIKVIWSQYYGQLTLCSWPAHEEMHKKSSLYDESNTVRCENLLCKKPLVPPWLWFEPSILCFCQSVIKILCQMETHLDVESQDWIHLKQMNILQCCPTINVTCKALTNQNLSPASTFTGLCSSRARWPQAPNFCPRATRKSQIFHLNLMLGTLNSIFLRAQPCIQVFPDRNFERELGGWQ